LTVSRLPRDRFGRVSEWIDDHIRWLLVTPAVLLVLAVVVFPLLFSLWVSVVRYDFRSPETPFVGLDNYFANIRDPVFQTSIVRTVLLVGALVVVELFLGLVLALAALRPFRGRRVLVPILLLPLFMSPIVVAQVWRLLWDRGTGPVNYLLGLVVPGEVTINWFTEMPWNWIAVVVTDAWQWTPFMFVILLAGLTAIPGEYFEAASLDGASTLQTIRRITIPLLVPVILVAVVFRMIDAFKFFDIIFILTSGGPGTSTYTASFYLYQQVFPQFKIAHAAAGSWLFLILVTVLCVGLVRRIMPRTIR
jgi:multiple sugar transport system permease protein